MESFRKWTLLQLYFLKTKPNQTNIIFEGFIWKAVAKDKPTIYYTANAIMWIMFTSINVWVMNKRFA